MEQAEQAQEFYPGFYWKFLAVALTGNIINHAEAHLKSHPFTVALFAGVSVCLCLVVIRDLRRREGRSVSANLLYLFGAACLALYYLLPSAGLWLACSGYAFFLGSFLVQYLTWKHGTGRTAESAS